MENLTVIIPIHTTKNNLFDWFKNSIKSIENQSELPNQVIVVHGSEEELINSLKTFDFGSLGSIVKLLHNTTGKEDYSSQVNFASDYVETDYFSVLECDDEYSKIWVKNVNKYVSYYKDVDVFLPLVVETDVNGNFLSFSNEPVWAKDFSEELGFLDENVLNAFSNFNSSGMVIKTSVFKEIGKLKSSMKLTFNYEFLLRLSHFDHKIMVIPKIGYKHVNQREGSLFNFYKETVNQPEAMWWMNLAKKEYHFKKDREITYTE